MLFEQASQWAQQVTGMEFSQEQEGTIAEFLCDRHEVRGDDDLACSGEEVILAAIHLGIIPRGNVYCVRHDLSDMPLPPVKMTRKGLLDRIETLMALPDAKGHHEALMVLADYLGAKQEIEQLQAAETLRPHECTLWEFHAHHNAAWIRNECYQSMLWDLDRHHGNLHEDVQERMDDIADPYWWTKFY